MPDQLRAAERDEGARVRRQLPRPDAAVGARDALAEQARAVRARRLSRDVRAVSAVDDSPNGDEPSAPSGFYAAAATGDIAELVERFGDAKNDPLLAAEVASLAAVHAALATGEYFCTIIEPMQSEGGDRYATERFFRALRLLTRHHKTFLVFDEVQVGFGLGGPFAWHSKFRLMSSRGQQDYPDAVTFAKRAQVGVVMSRFADPEPTSAHGASLVRGRIHADMVSTSHNAERLEKLVWPRLNAIAKAYPHLVQHPRATGYAFAFELPTTRCSTRISRSGSGAVRSCSRRGPRPRAIGLSDSFLAREIDQLFETIRQVAVVARRARGA